MFGEFVELNNRVKIKELTSIRTPIKIEVDTIIEKSVIWDNVNIGAKCKIIESIICDNFEIGNNVVLYNIIVTPNCKISDYKELRDKTIELGEQI